MARLIDADADKCRPYLYEYLTDTGMIAAQDAINAMPTIDAVPVVRCRDCKKGWPAGEYVYCMKPHAGNWPTHKWDWYCADGERKEDAK